MKETTAPPEEELIRVLVVGRDQLIRSGRQCEVDFIPTGRSVAPDAPLGYAPTLLSRLEMLWAFIRGRYRYALLPVPAPGGVIARLLKLRPVAFLTRTLRPGRTVVALIDEEDYSRLPEAMILALRPDHCWKLHLSADEQELFGSTTIHLLPRWVYPPATGWSRIPWKQKEIDLLLPPGPDCPARRMVVQWLERFRKERRLKIRIAPAEITEGELHELMGRSRIVLSPVGEGLHHYRHYQAMLHGAVPMINQPGAVQTTLVQGENVLFFEEDEESFRTILFWAGEHPGSVEILARQARQYAWQAHTPIAVSRMLLERAGLPPEVA